MKNFKRLDLIGGWVAFAIAAVTYLLTIEPTASLWDCGEFIVSANKLEVGHPPGAPLFALIGRLFAMLAPTPQAVPIMLNAMSALASAFTIMFLFWTITHLVRKFFVKKAEDLSASEIYITLGCGIVGALAYTFSDTFWFSAVEGEVYATSSLFTAVVFWAGLKWEEVSDTKYANRWLVLIAYLTGLSIGVHLLNLLVIPAIAYIYYFKKYTISTKGIILTFITGCAVLVGVLYIIIPWIPKLAFQFDLFFVNSLGFPINSGVLVFIVLLAALLSFLIYYTHKKGKALANTIVLCIAVIALGYASYAMIVIRASANTPMDQNDPDNPNALLGYLNREQYGDNPLIYGQYYNAEVDSIIVKDEYVEDKTTGKYVKAGEKTSAKYQSAYCTIFPRMYSGSEQRHIEGYENWGNIKTVRLRNENGERGQNVKCPTFIENLRFFFNYQVYWMYIRYFMWNFSGRQNDIQGDGNCLYGNWITGIKFIDNWLVGPQDDLPTYLATNKGRNAYYMLPFLLGLLGLFVHWKYNKKDFSIVMMLFLLTGLAIIVYLNQTPYQPRERDYAYAGSFYAFAIWIGIGVMGVYEMIKKFTPKTAAALTSTAISLLLVPGIMAKENWDDHDRSGRYITVDFGTNYLESCDQNGILTTYGDNDTFSLWYSQEVEGVRTDVRDINVSYIYSDWYIEQMMRTVYTSKAIKFTATPENILGARRNTTAVIDATINNYCNNKGITLAGDYKNRYEMKDALKFVYSGKAKINNLYRYSKPVDYFPSQHFKMTVDKDKVRKSGIVPASLPDSAIYDVVEFDYASQQCPKNQLAIFDIVANNFEERPVYLGLTTPSANSAPFKGHLKTVGLAQLITPEKLTDSTSIDIEKSYDLFMNKYKYRGLNDSSIYIDKTVERLTQIYRTGFVTLANALSGRGDYERARKVLDKYREVLPVLQAPYAATTIMLIYSEYNAKDNETARNLTNSVLAELDKELTYYGKLSHNNQIGVSEDISYALSGLSDLYRITRGNGEKELSDKIGEKLEVYLKYFRSSFE